MKKLIFVILKIVEILGFIFVPYYIGSLFGYWAEDPQWFLMDWVVGMFLTIFIGAALYVLYKAIIKFGPDFITLNKEWAEKIHSRLGRD